MNNLRTIRFLGKLTQDSLAKMAKTHQTVISKLERDLLPNTPGTLRLKEKIVQTLGVKLDDVFRDDGKCRARNRKRKLKRTREKELLRFSNSTIRRKHV
jgi:transcriptional regulator with XRE-family HTH domain